MKRIYLHPMLVRVCHWINAFSVLVLILTGIQIRYRDVIQVTSFRTAVDIQNIFGFVLLFNFIIWIIYYVVSGKFRTYIPPFSFKGFIRPGKRLPLKFRSISMRLRENAS